MPYHRKKRNLSPRVIVPFFLTLIVASGVVIYRLNQRRHHTARDLVWNGELPEGPRSITSEQAKQDINLLLYALHHAYGGRDFIDPAILAKAEKQLQGIPKNKPISTHTLWYKIHEVFLDIPDSHLTLSLPKNLIPSLPKDLKDSFIRSRKALFTTRGVGNNKNTTQCPWLVQTIPYQNKNMLLIAITRFPHPDSNQWKGFLTQVQAALPQADAIILDLRNNTGGNSAIAEELAKLLYNNSNVPDPVDYIYFRNTPASYIIHANWAKHQLQKGLAKGDNMESIQQLYDELLREAEHAKQKNSPRYDIRKRPLVMLKDFIDKPIAILTNKRCGSTGEIMVNLLEAHPRVTRIGEATSGCIHFSNMGFFFLPHSKLCINMPCQYRSYRDKRFIERTGIAPHIYVSAGKDAFDVALTYLKQKLSTVK